MARLWMMITAFALLPMVALAEDRLVRLAVPEALIESGLIQHIAPRFALKTAHRVEIVTPGATAEIAIGAQGRALFEGAGAVWHLQVLDGSHPGADRFARWLTSDIGMRTIMGFAPKGVQIFTPPQTVVAAKPILQITGDATLGHQLSVAKCGRCHAADELGRKNDIGSTPSFFVLRSLPDWEERFSAFYVLKPHGAFTQVADITPPFPQNLPSPIVPIEMTLEELDAIMAYVAGLEAADLGQPLIHQ